MDIFAHASREKLRFKTTKGSLSVEDLWDLPLTSSDDNLSIDAIGKGVVNAVKDNEGNESFVIVKGTEENVTLKVSLAILEHIRDHKLDYAARADKAVLTKAKKQRLLEILAKKQDDALEENTAEEIEKMIAEL
jgi:hypothetical protein